MADEPGKPHIPISNDRVKLAPKPKGGFGRYVYSNSPNHRQHLADQLKDVVTASQKRPADKTAYVTISAIANFPIDKLEEAGFHIHSTSGVRVKLGTIEPNRIGGSPSQFEAVSFDEEDEPMGPIDDEAIANEPKDEDEDGKTGWLYSVIASIPAAEQGLAQQILSQEIQPGDFKHIIQLRPFTVDDRLSADVAKSPDSTHVHISFLRGLAAAVYINGKQRLLELGEKLVHVRATTNELEAVARLSGPEARTLAQALPAIESIQLEPKLSLGQQVKGGRLKVPDKPPSGPTTKTAICVIDTGVDANNPWAKAVLQAEDRFPPSLSPTHAEEHGTAVAGLAAYHDFFSSGEVKDIHPIHSAKILDSQTGTLNLGKTVADVIAAKKDQCRIFSLSINESDPSFAPTDSMELIDSAVRDHDVVLINSAGNIDSGLLPAIHKKAPYPSYYLKPDVHQVRMYSPARGVNIVAVGSAALAPFKPNYIAAKGYPSAHTRFGPAKRKPDSKPDLCEDGGNHVVRNGLLAADDVAAPVSLKFAGAGTAANSAANFTGFPGTSASAPLVAWSAATILDKFPGASANLIRALLLMSARPTAELPTNYRRRALLGLGRPAVNNVLNSQNNRVLFVREGQMPLNQVTDIPFHVPQTFAQDPSFRVMRACLVFNPPVDAKERLNYAAVNIVPSLQKIVGWRPSAKVEHNWGTKDYHSVRYAEWTYSPASRAIKKRGARDWAIRLTPSINKLSKAYKGGLKQQAYALVVALESPRAEVDYYSEISVAWKLGVPVKTPVKTQITL